MLAVSVLYADAKTDFPKLDRRVTDFTGTLGNQQMQSMERELESFEDTTSTQVVVLMIKSLEGESIEEYANRTFLLNNIGQEKKNNGVLLLVAKDDRKVRIEVGYGLEGALTDAISSRIIRSEITPKFKEDNYFDGIRAGVNAIIRAVKGEYKADPGGDKEPAISAGLIFFIILFVLFFLMPLLTSRRRSVIGSDGHDYFSGWGYGGGSFGGFGGSGGGGFGGGFSGGGGLSGGGGASGSW
ncbi:MAG: TPM domain-containing protein [Bacteroidetes bacterium]|nr:TPM domain-containing protein [Bacteroidota bacterium]